MKILKNCVLLSLLALVAGSPAFGEKWPALKVEKFKELEILVEGLDKNAAGVTKEDIVKAVKLKLLSVGIKPVEGGRPQKHYLYINLNIFDDASAFSVSVRLRKQSRAYGVDPKVAGASFAPRQGAYTRLGLTGNLGKPYILQTISSALDDFLLDYLESNVE